MGNPEMANLQDHYPERVSQVELWIKDRRDQYPQFVGGVETESWRALDDLLDDYRLAADVGMSLEEVVNGEHPPPEPKPPKRPMLKNKITRRSDG